MIQITNLNKYYKSGQGNFHALTDINLSLPDKGIVFITGKSGSGKSTLLNIIGGIDSYDSGDLSINGISTKSFTRNDYNSYRNTYIGFIFQEFNVIKTLTVYENIALSIQLHHEKIRDHHNEILDVLKKVGLQGKENRKMNQISGGEKQRVAIARSLIKNPQVIIADEPTGNLDTKNRDTIMKILKELSTERLVLIVTHDRFLADLYGDRAITLKDGKIIADSMQDVKITSTSDTLNLHPIAPPISTSISLAFKAFKKNIVRYIFIILLFSLSLIFAGSVVNLYLANTTKEYATYQKEYANFVVDLNQTYTENDIKVQSAFDEFNYVEFTNKYAQNGQMMAYKSIIFDLVIKEKENDDFSFYQTTISRLNVYEDIDQFTLLTDNLYEEDYNCLITDYVAMSLIKNNYFNDPSITNVTDVAGQHLTHPYFKNSLYITNIIDTNYEEFSIKYENGEFDDTKISVTFNDNLPFYNAIYMNKSDLFPKEGSNNPTELFTYPNNVDTVTDDLIYEGLGNTGYQKDVKITVYSSQYQDRLTGKAPVKPESGEPTQIAVSKSVLRDLYKKNFDLGITFSESKLSPGLLNDEGYTAYFKFTGVKRSQATYNFIITGIVEDEADNDEYTIYLPSYTYQSYITASFERGGYLLMTINDNIDVNANIYRDMLNNDITINNLSFKKLQLVDNFIKDNLFLFAGLFFVFCLFSVLMIFNFIIINIKNSTRDIGIYMSLGMNGFKISLIYFFQIMIVSITSIIIGAIGSKIFLVVLDNIFSNQSPINFEIIKYTPLGILSIIILAFVAPTIAVILPLINLSTKKPIDVIKVA